MERCSMKQMPTILCVEKLGAIKELNVKNVNEDESRAGLKTETDLNFTHMEDKGKQKELSDMCIRKNQRKS